MSVLSSSENAESIQFWNEIGVPKFQRFKPIFMHGLGAHGGVALERHAPKPGERVLDVGCGWGDSTLELARRVGPAGSVLGIDCCRAFVADGEAEARAAGAGNVSFVVADAQAHRFESTFDLCFSRFGTMFFMSPVHAMRHLRAALDPGGRLLMVVWRRLAENDWVRIPKEVVSRFLPPPPGDGKSCGPGPFSMADEETVTGILEAAGFTDVKLDRIDLPILVGEDVQRAIDFQLQIGPAGEIVREAGALGVERRTEIEAELRRSLEPYRGERGVVMPSSSWAILARPG
jgi:ubiquinone/menaquinone biosynthesis C-methylase UbiE